MSVEGSVRPRSAFCVVLGNEKGGSGKSTAAMHIAVALLKAGQRVATIDLDFAPEELHPLHREPQSLGQARPARSRIAVALLHRAQRRRAGRRTTKRPSSTDFAAAVDAIEHTHDFVVIDTPGNDSYLMRLAHSMADTLITPLNDSFVDFDVLGTVDPATFAVTGTSHFADMVREARRQRRVVDHATDRLDRGAQPPCRCSARATSGWSARGLQELVAAARLPRHRWLCRARGLPRILSARADRARQSRRGDARHAPEPVARDRRGRRSRRCSSR